MSPINSRVQVRLLRGTERIIKPSWIVDSIAAGRLLPEADYSLLPDLGFPKTSYFTKSALLASSAVASSAAHSHASSKSDAAPAGALITHSPLLAANTIGAGDEHKGHSPHSPELLPRRKALAPPAADSARPNAAHSVAPEAPPRQAHATVNLPAPPAPVAPPPPAEPPKGPAEPPKGPASHEDKLAAFKTAKDDGFLASYRKSSRLHYLSTWKAQFQESLSRELRQLLQADDVSTPTRLDEPGDAEGADVAAFQLRHANDDDEQALCLQPHSGGVEEEAQGTLALCERV